MSKPKPVYAPLPVRALADPELDGADFRVLGIIAAHDRLNANGSGCYASHATLCTKLGIHYVTFSKSATKLGRLGYITAEPHPMNRRTRVYRVTYTDHDRTVMAAREDKTVSPQAKDGVSEQAKEGAKIVSPTNSQAIEGAKESSDKISCEAINTFPEGDLIDSTEAARSGERGLRGEGNGRLTHNAILAISERRIAEMKREPNPDDGPILERYADALEEIASEHVQHDDPVGGQARRLYEEVASMLPSWELNE